MLPHSRHFLRTGVVHAKRLYSANSLGCVLELILRGGTGTAAAAGVAMSAGIGGGLDMATAAGG